MKLDAKGLRKLEEPTTPPTISRRPIYFILDNVYDTYNIGGLFRLADALATEKIYICGNSETPPNHRIKKASIGTYKVVPWEYKKTAIEAIAEIRNTKYETQPSIVAIEQSPSSIPYTQYNYTLPIAFVLGNETSGLSEETLKACDAIVEIPMYGINKSLNVIISAAIVGFHAGQYL